MHMLKFPRSPAHKRAQFSSQIKPEAFSAFMLNTTVPAIIVVPYCAFSDGAVSTLKISLVYMSKTTKHAKKGESIVVTVVDLNRTAFVTGGLRPPVACGSMILHALQFTHTYRIAAFLFVYACVRCH